MPEPPWKHPVGLDAAVHDWMTGKRYIEKLSMDPSHVRLDRLNSGAPLLDAHFAYSVKDMLGAVVRGSATMQAKQGRATSQTPVPTHSHARPIVNGVRKSRARHASRDIERGESACGGMACG